MTVEAAGLCLDYSKNRIINQTIKLLLQLANESCSARADRRDVRVFNGRIDIGSFEVQRPTTTQANTEVAPYTAASPTPRGRHSD